ncbi:hypothetical protein ACN6K6_000644 [Streptomyces violaceoruber]|uniref:hypothetical protein n=1 Tax=Streptomyces violaceoruber group TaxID=2867121 RepID=UPI003656B4AD
MNPSRILRWHYVAAAALVGHCAATSLNANAWWYGTGLFIASLLFLVALARDIVAADRVCKAALDEATRMDRAARMRDRQAQDRAVIDGWDPWLCCVAAFTSRGAEHDTTHCTRKDQAA